MLYGQAERRTGSKSDERSGGCDGEERRAREGEEALRETAEGNSESGSGGALEGQGRGFVYFIETEDGQSVKKKAAK
jgi:hypothetical protein